MSRARKAADSLLKSYYDSLGITVPDWHARKLLECIRLAPERRAWESSFQIELAEQILDNARFDVDEVAENHLRVALRVQNLSQLDSAAAAPVYGCAWPRHREIAVCERALEYEPLYRATVMHEIAHIQLHRMGREVEMNYAPRSRSRPPREREADAFMVRALLPDAVVILGIAWVAQMWRINPLEAVRTANGERGRWQWRHKYMQILIDELCVSRHLLSLKLLSMDIFSRRTVEFHLSYRLENKWLPRRAVRAPRDYFSQIRAGLDQLDWMRDTSP